MRGGKAAKAPFLIFLHPGFEKVAHKRVAKKVEANGDTHESAPNPKVQGNSGSGKEKLRENPKTAENGGFGGVKGIPSPPCPVPPPLFSSLGQASTVD